MVCLATTVAVMQRSCGVHPSWEVLGRHQVHSGRREGKRTSATLGKCGCGWATLERRVLLTDGGTTPTASQARQAHDAGCPLIRASVIIQPCAVAALNPAGLG